MRQSLARLVGFTLLLTVAAACGGAASGELSAETDPAATAVSSSPAATTDTGETEAAATGAGDSGVSVAVAETDLGGILVDGDGRTLYLFKPDGQGASTCTGDCAATWPPLIADGEPAAGEGADSAMLSTSEREDGETQATYNGWPLYYFSGDEAPGDVNGQGVGDAWFAVTPAGAPAQAAAAQESTGDPYDY